MAVCDYIPSSVFYPTPPRPLPSHVTKGVCRLPDPINAHLGARIRLRRRLLGLSQTHLADAIGLTYQQVQKYERGINRMAAATLYRIAEALDVPIGFFFDDLPGVRSPPPAFPNRCRDPFGALRLLRHYDAMPVGLRRHILDLVETLAGDEA